MNLSDGTCKMLGEPTFGPQMGAVRQRLKYASRPPAGLR